MSAIGSLSAPQQELFARAVVAYPWLTEQDFLLVATGPQDQVDLLLAQWHRACDAPQQSFWDELIACAMAAATIAGVVSGISGGVQSLYALKSL